jgi:hypothetical protein
VLGKCANNLCSTRRTEKEGKLFRLDLDIGNTAGATQQKTTYIWLCSLCARQMTPDVSVAGDRVLVRLASTSHKSVHDGGMPRVN